MLFLLYYKYVMCITFLLSYILVMYTLVGISEIKLVSVSSCYGSIHAKHKSKRVFISEFIAIYIFKIYLRNLSVKSIL